MHVRERERGKGRRKNERERDTWGHPARQLPARETWSRTYRRKERQKATHR